MELASLIIRMCIVVGNVLCLIFAIACLVLWLSVGYFQDYPGSAFCILISFLGVFAVFSKNRQVNITFAILFGMDLLVMLGNGIFISLVKGWYAEFCIHNISYWSPRTGCYNWLLNGDAEKATGVIVGTFLIVFIRGALIAAECLLPYD